MSVLGTLIVKFVNGVCESEVRRILDEHDLRGTLACPTTNKYAVDVPAGKEEHFAKQLKENCEVKSVFYTPTPKKTNFR